ncbi:hypothetical protein [Cyanobium sp. Morenito 9A2]|uniref:hypothetical protein n=1 Tax=Cyanobium sp. Morenito 9A2 TaxID=2823718 RepID=UPI0020CC3C24|nr:hypothetical protein [Cyanobium sp. Morenito 9A2]MCP9848756.1 hypothetical protein [Cyanobium sp. Morenito 9A2]
MVHPSDDNGDLMGASGGGGEHDGQLPLPATAPLLGPNGALIYTTSDGRQVIVCDDPSLARRPELLEAFQALRAGAPELKEVERAAERWIEVAERCGLQRELALALVIERLKRQSEDSPDRGRHG